MWIVRLVKMANNGWNPSNPVVDHNKVIAAKANEVDFQHTLEDWLHNPPADKYLAGAYKSNCAGLSASLTKATAKDRYIAVYNQSAVPMMNGCPVFLSAARATVLCRILVKFGEIDLSEVSSVLERKAVSLYGSYSPGAAPAPKR